jgi:hypothetical protein
MYMKVSHEQFVLDGERLTHQPTGAVFWIGQKDIVECDWGTAGKPVFSGNDYDPDELKEAAWEVFKLERARCI